MDIVGTIASTIDLLKTIAGYIQAVKGAKEDRMKLHSEISALGDLLKILRSRLDNTNGTNVNNGSASNKLIEAGVDPPPPTAAFMCTIPPNPFNRGWVGNSIDDTRATGDGHDSRPRLNNAIVMTRRRQPFPFNMALKFAPPPFIPPASTTPSSRHAAAAIALRLAFTPSLTFTPFDSHSRRHPSHPFAANLHYHDTTSSRSLTIATSSSPPCSLFMGFQCIWTRKSHSSQMTDDRRLNHDDNAVSPPSPPIAL
ncbi:hypothetical protein BD779DRAFT_1680496 [Infundibulicybe gibba]|nr:hypothetical protein BD779DRAFT_1680496 [Infundibulicybe gibba]